MRTSRTQPIDWLFPRVRQRVLSLLLLHPDERWHLRDIVRRTGSAVGAVHRELAGLTESGIIARVRDGNRTYYQASASCPFFAELSGLMRKTWGMADVLRRALAHLSGSVDCAFIYGSQANGTATARSDVDLLVVGDVDEMALHRAVSKAEEALARSVNYTLLSRKEFARRRREKAGFLARVLAGDKIPVLGEMDGLR
jgi:predicted nucleotidyltransferase